MVLVRLFIGVAAIAVLCVEAYKPKSTEQSIGRGRTQVMAAERSAKSTGPITDHASYDVAR